MKLFGFEIVRQRAAVPSNLSSLTSQSHWWNWWSPIHEPFTGAWQRNITLDTQPNLLAFSAVYACVTGIASDIAKMRIKLIREVTPGIWDEIHEGSPFLPVLRKPNHYQTRIKFIQQWMVSKLLSGNTYVLKERDQRGMVRAMYVLDPMRVKALVAEDGSIYYELQNDALSQVKPEVVTVPASEIIHDSMVGLWHQLMGVSPLYACSRSATMGNRIQDNSTNQFANQSRPGGILSAPGPISNESAARIKAQFEQNFGGANVGRLAVLGDGLKFEPMVLTADVQQLIEQLKWTVEDVARAFRYPMDKLGVPMPYSTGANSEIRTTNYYSDCLHVHIEDIEESLDLGLAIPHGMGTEMDLDNLLRMDTAALFESNAKAARFMTVNEQRWRANLPPVEGGDTIYLQEQDHALEALAERDESDDPFGTKPEPPQPALPEPPAVPQLPPARGMTLDDLDFLETELRRELVLT